jgi:hypothetical protein
VTLPGSARRKLGTLRRFCQVPLQPYVALSMTEFVRRTPLLEQLAMSLVRESSWGDGCLFKISEGR